MKTITVNASDAVLFCHGDFQCEVVVKVPKRCVTKSAAGYVDVTIASDLLRAFVAEQIRAHLIAKAEDATINELLGVPK